MLILFTNILGAGVIFPILPLYAEGSFRGSVTQITLLASAFFGAQFVAAPWLGKLSDRYGRRPVLLVSQLGTVLAFVIFIFAGELGAAVDALGLSLPLTGGMLMLFAGRILDGITGGNITAAQAYVADVTDEDERARGLGLLQAATGAGFVFGPALGGILAAYGPRMPFIGATVITTVTLLLTTFTLDESLPPEERNNPGMGVRERGLPASTLLAHRPFVLMLVIGFIASLAFASLPATFSLFADHVVFADAPQDGRVQLYIGLMMAFLGLMQVVTQLLWVGPLVRRFGQRRLLAIGDVALSVTFFVLSAASSPLLVTAMLGLFAFGFGTSEPTNQALVSRLGTRRTSGYLLGLYQSARSLALIFGPILAGYAYEAISPRSVFFAGGWLMVAALVFVLVLLRVEIEPIKE
jgi:DHA1 family tetracycline resistance protein-like MFS transporter